MGYNNGLHIFSSSILQLSNSSQHFLGLRPRLVVFTGAATSDLHGLPYTRKCENRLNNLHQLPFKVTNVIGHHKCKKYHKCKNCQHMCLDLLPCEFDHMYPHIQDSQTELVPTHIVLRTESMGAQSPFTHLNTPCQLLPPVDQAWPVNLYASLFWVVRQGFPWFFSSGNPLIHATSDSLQSVGPNLQ